MKTTIWAILTGIIAIIIEMPANEAKTNIFSWLNLFGLSPDWAQIEKIDSILRFSVYTALIVSIFLLLMRNRNVNSNKMHNTTMIDNSVKSENQTGGITAQTVNIGKQDRILTPSLKESLLSILACEQELRICCAVNNAESEKFAREILNFLTSKGYTFSTFTALSMSGGDGSPVISRDNTATDILVGENINTDMKLKIIGGLAIGLEI